jgi:hypothetical protein
MRLTDTRIRFGARMRAGNAKADGVSVAKEMDLLLRSGETIVFAFNLKGPLADIVVVAPSATIAFRYVDYYAALNDLPDLPGRPTRFSWQDHGPSSVS